MGGEKIDNILCFPFSHYVGKGARRADRGGQNRKNYRSHTNNSRQQMLRLTGANGMPGRHIAEKLTTSDIPHVSTGIVPEITDETAEKNFYS
jgi:hypothetical protein